MIGAHAVLRLSNPYLFSLPHSRLCELVLDLSVDVVLHCLSATHPYPCVRNTHGLCGRDKIGCIE
jgi:hypothetical protein